MKNTGSAIFDEAYFVVKESAYELDTGADMVSEATRIIEENEGIKKKAPRRFPSPREWIFYGVGFVGGAVASLIIALIT